MAKGIWNLLSNRTHGSAAGRASPRAGGASSGTHGGDAQSAAGGTRAVTAVTELLEARRLLTVLVDMNFNDADVPPGTHVALYNEGEPGGPLSRHPSYPTGTAVITPSRRVRADNSGQSSVYLAAADTMTAGYTVEATVTRLSDVGRAGVVGRWGAAANSGYYAQYRPFHGWQLFRQMNGGPTQLGTTFAQNLVVGQEYKLALSFAGNQITLSVNGSAVITAADGTFTAPGRAGFWFTGATGMSDTSGVHVDNLRVVDSSTAFADLEIRDPTSALIAQGGTYGFGEVVRDTSQSVTLSLVNPGGAPLTLSGITTSGGVVLSGAPGVGTTIPAGGHVTFVAAMNTATAGAVSGRVRVNSNDATSPYEIHLTATVVEPPSFPSAPTLLEATAPTFSRVDLSWQDNSANETGFKIERSTDGAAWTAVATVPAGATAYSDLAVTQTTTYHYRVSATNELGGSPWAGPVTITTPVNADVARTFAASDGAIVWGGAYTADLPLSGRNARGFRSQLAEWTAVVQGRAATMEVYPQRVDDLKVFVDGVEMPAPNFTGLLNQWTTVQLFADRPDGPHVVTVRSNYGSLQSYFPLANMLSVTGSNPRLAVRPGFSQNIYDATFPGIQHDGTMTPGTFSGNPNSLTGVDSSIRFRVGAGTTAVKLWMNQATDRVQFSIDDVEQQTNSIVVPNFAGSAVGGMGWYDFVTGLDGGSHELRLWFHGTGTGSENSVVARVMTVGGAIDPTPLPPLPMLVGFGDSITLAQQAPTNHDSGLGHVHLIGAARKMATINLGIRGSTVHDLPGITGEGATRTGQIPAGASDIFVLYGHNDAANTSIDAAMFRASYATMLSGILSRAPGARVYCVEILPTTQNTAAGKRAAFNAAIADVVAGVADARVALIDTDGIGINPTSGIHTSDGTHPNTAGYVLLQQHFQSYMPPAGQTTPPGDTAAPTLLGATVNAAGTEVTLTFSEPVVNVFGVPTLTVGGSTRAATMSGTGATRVLTPATPIGQGQSVQVALAAGAFEDASGNDIAAVSGRTATNNSTADQTAPTASGWAVSASGLEITATLSESGVGPATGTGGFTLGNTARSVTGWYVSGTALTLTLSGPVFQGEANPLVGYSAAAGAIQDAGGNALASFADVVAANNSTAPAGDVNHAPVAADDVVSTPVDTAVTVDVLANDSDPDGDTLTVVGHGTAAHGTVSLLPDGRLTYTPTPGFQGSDEFAYFVDDGEGGGTATGRVRLTVGTPPNEAPVVSGLSTNAGEIGNVLEGQVVNLSATFSDGAADTHSALIAWGDGSVTAGTVNAVNRTVTGSHVYAGGGAYTVTVTVTDNHNASVSRQATAYVTGSSLHGSVLHVIGTRSDERVYVATATGQVRVTAPFHPGYHRYFNPAAITRVVMMLGDGNDQGSVAGDVPGTAILLGGAGNDTLTAGTRALMIGGAGADTLFGSAASDILVAGTTEHDGDPLRLAMVLDNSLPLSVSSVFNDANADTLTGGAGVDLFWGNFSGGGVLDSLGQALQPGEVRTDVGG